MKLQETLMIALCASVALPMAGNAADYFWNNAEGGGWSALANWKLGSKGTGGDAETLPGETDTVYFCTGTYTSTLSENVRVYKIKQENVDRSPVCNVRFDLNGYELVSVDSPLVNGDVTHGEATMTFTNGCVCAESGFVVGQQSTASWRGNLFLDGVNCSLTNNLTPQGASPKVTIRHGAKLSCNDLSGTIKKRTNSVVIEGAGVVVDLRGKLQFTGPHNVRIADGAFIKTVGSFGISGYEQDFSNEPTGQRGGHVVIDNATVTNTGLKANINLGASVGDGTLRNCALVLTNNAKCVSFGYGFVGGNQNGTAFSDGNRIEVVDGSLLDFNGLEFGTSRTCDGLTIARAAGSANNVLYVKDGTVKSRFLRVGNNGVSSAGTCATNNVVHFSGTHPLVWTIAQHNDGYSMEMRSGSVLRFDVGEDGYANVPLKVDGTLKVSRPSDATHVEFNVLSNKILIAASDFDRAQPETRLVLIETKNDSTAALQELVENSTILSDNPGALSVENSGKRLVYTSPRRSGLMIVVR